MNSQVGKDLLPRYGKAEHTIWKVLLGPRGAPCLGRWWEVPSSVHGPSQLQSLASKLAGQGLSLLQIPGLPLSSW